MSYLILGLVIAVVVYGAAGRRLARRYADWRLAVSVTAVGLFAATGFVALRGGWGKAIVLAVIGMALIASARWPRAQRPGPTAGMSLHEARSVLGVGAEASAEEIRAAYARLIRRVHPDAGGAPGLAAALNQARDRLLKP